MDRKAHVIDSLESPKLLGQAARQQNDVTLHRCIALLLRACVCTVDLGHNHRYTRILLNRRWRVGLATHLVAQFPVQTFGGCQYHRRHSCPVYHALDSWELRAQFGVQNFCDGDENG